MARVVLVAGLLIALLTGANSQPQSKSSNPAADAPRRTILTTPADVHSDSAPAALSAPAAPDASADALEKYREMWRKMSPAQQKAFLDSGGYTPEQYERLLRPKGAGPGPTGSADPRTKIDPTMDSLNNLLQNLDTIRDANLGRVQAETCPPEVAARIADLRVKLRNFESESSGVPVTAAPVRPRPSAAPVDPLAIATDWYKPGAPAAAIDKALQATKLLAAALPAAEAAVPNPAASEQEIARAKTEIEQLSGACAAPVR